MIDQPSSTLSRRVALPLLLLILLAGFILRVWNVNYDRGIGSHPDERSTACLYAPTIHLPQSWDEFWDPHRSPLNPLWSLDQQQRRSFTYGHFPLYLGIGASNLMHDLAPAAQAVGAPADVVTLMARGDTGCDAIAVAGRLTIAFLDTLTILFLYLLGGKLRGRGTGLLAAAFYAFTAQAIQLSHFFAMDPASTTFTVLAILGGVLMTRDRRMRMAVLTGVAIGLAVASKFSALPLLAVPVVAALLANWRAYQTSQVTGKPLDARVQFAALAGVVVAWIVAFVAFFVTSPYAVLDWQNFVQATLIEQGAMVRGIADMPFTRQYRNTTPYLYFIQQQVEWGLGWPLGVVAVLGTLFAAGAAVGSLYRMLVTGVAAARKRSTRRWLADDQLANLVVWSWVLPYFGLTGAFLAKFNRYMSPVLPFVLLWAAWLIVVLWQLGAALRRGPVAPAATSMGAVGGAAIGPEPIGPDAAPALAATGVTIDGELAAASGVSAVEPADVTIQRDPVAADVVADGEPVGVTIDGELVTPTGVPDLEPAGGAASTGDVADVATAPPVAVAPEQTTPARRRSNLGLVWQGAAILLGVVGLVGGVFWSLAYVNGVYSHEHTWITASRWMYENIPSGSKILWELWDDPLPKAIPGEPGMDMGTRGLTNIDWSPYEEDTADKYAILKQKLREADYVAYSSKRIYDSVDELPQRYPMTNLYYQAMRDGRLGFELAAEFTSPPQLLGLKFDDRHADESWSLYDHPQVSVYRKVRDLSDAEFDALFDHLWEQAQPYYRGPDSPLSPFLNLLGLGSEPGSENAGLINRLIALASGGASATSTPPAERKSLMFDKPIEQLPVVDNYRWNTAASASSLLAILVWWLLLTLLSWLVWPIAFVIFAPLRDRGYFISRTFGWLLGGWLLWILVSVGLFQNTVRDAWISVALLAVAGIAFAIRQRRALGAYLRGNWKLLIAGEAVFAVAFLFFITIRLYNPDLWQPWFGGEKQMEFAFLNGILRSPTFPPVDPHFSGGFINYYYFGLYLVAYLIKLTGIYAEVAFNLTIATLFALTVINLFAVAYSAVKGHAPLAVHAKTLPLRVGFWSALLAPLFVTIIGNLDGFAQVVRNLATLGSSPFDSALPALKPFVDAGYGLQKLMAHQAEMPPYDFWGPSRVVTPTINEFPFWSFLFADLHPHIIGIPLAGMFLALVLVLIENANTNWRQRWPYGLGLLAVFALFLGSMAAVNLWELPTYFGLGVLAFLISQFRGKGRIQWLLTIGVSLLYGALAYVLFLPFFRSYVNVGANGVGLLRAPDPPEQWLLVWGFLGFMFLSWTLFVATRKVAPELDEQGHAVGKPAGIERATGLIFRRFDSLPRAVYLQQKLVARPSLTYLLLLALIPLLALFALGAVLLGWIVLALCLLPLGLAVALLWRRGREADAGSAFAVMLGATGLALLAGTQVVYLKDFLDGSDYYRMNTLFKFFNQAWVLWGVMAAIATPRLIDEWIAPLVKTKSSALQRGFRYGWVTVFVILLAASLAYPILGTPARLDQRMPGWRPPIGTLNGLDFMREGSYQWPDFNNTIELSYEYNALQWLLDHVRGNATLLETSEVEYYRAWGTRMASNTGLSGLKGMHEQEQRYPEDVGERDGLHRELWSTIDIPRTQQIMNDLHVDLVYIGQLERFLHPDGVRKFEQMAGEGLLTQLYSNDRVTIYVVPGHLQADAAGIFTPVAAPQTPILSNEPSSPISPLAAPQG